LLYGYKVYGLWFMSLDAAVLWLLGLLLAVAPGLVDKRMHVFGQHMHSYVCDGCCCAMAAELQDDAAWPLDPVLRLVCGVTWRGLGWGAVMPSCCREAAVALTAPPDPLLLPLAGLGTLASESTHADRWPADSRGQAVCGLGSGGGDLLPAHWGGGAGVPTDSPEPLMLSLTALMALPNTHTLTSGHRCPAGVQLLFHLCGFGVRCISEVVVWCSEVSVCVWQEDGKPRGDWRRDWRRYRATCCAGYVAGGGCASDWARATGAACGGGGGEWRGGRVRTDAHVCGLALAHPHHTLPLRCDDGGNPRCCARAGQSQGSECGGRAGGQGGAPDSGGAGLYGRRCCPCCHSCWLWRWVGGFEPWPYLPPDPSFASGGS